MEDWKRRLVLAELDKLLGHPLFEKKERLREFLRFIVTHTVSGELARLKETVIGVEVYGRDPSYNPKASPIVRTQALRLRALLEEYYLTEGQESETKIRIPKGAYIASFDFGDSNAVEHAPGSEIAETEPPRPEGLRFDPPASTSDFAGRLLRQRPIRFAIVLLTLCLAAAALEVAMTHHGEKVWSARPFSRSGGSEEFASFSPDGRRLAFSRSGKAGSSRDIYLRDLDSETPIQLTFQGSENTRVAWSRDGKQIAFIRLTGHGRKDLIVMSLQDRKERKIAELEGDSLWLCQVPRISWGVDGRHLYTAEAFQSGGACSVVSVDLATSEIRRITESKSGVLGDLEPEVSPDGQQIAFLRNFGTMGGDIYVVGVNGGEVRRMTFDNRDIIGFCWTNDGQGFLVSSRRVDGVVRLWRLDRMGKQATQITDGAAMVSFPSTDRQGDRIVFTSYRYASSIWRITPTGEDQLISGYSNNSNPQLAPDGSKLVYRSDRSGSFELWVSDAAGAHSRRLTSFNGATVSNPVWSPDGRAIAFECRTSGHGDICVVDSDGKSPVRRVTNWSANQTEPNWSRDGKWLYYSSNVSGQWQIYKQQIAGGEPLQVTHQGGFRAIESWDGRSVYVQRAPPQSGISVLPRNFGDDNEGAKGQTQGAVLTAINSDHAEDWDVGPGGIVHRLQASNCSSEQAVLFDPATRTDRLWLRANGCASKGDRIFSVVPDGRGILLAKQESYGSYLEMLVAR